MAYISNNVTTSHSLTPTSAKQISALFRVGQVLQATIEPLKGQQVQITVGKQTLIATTTTNVRETGPVQVKVKQTQPTIQLEIVKTPPTKIPAQQTTLQSAYRQFMPNQIGLAQTAQQLSSLKLLPQVLLGPVNQLLEQITKSSTPSTAKALKEKLTNSGLFLESKLNQPGKLNVNNDLKGQFLKLQQLADNLNIKTPSPSLTQLSSTLGQAINRITVQQLQLYENPYVTPLELPFDKSDYVDKNYVEIRQNAERNPPTWEVLIEMHLPQGDMSSKLTLNHSHELNCSIWCETETLEQLIRQKIEQLQRQLSENSLLIQTIQIVHLKPEKSEQSTQIALIDIRI